MLIFFGKFSLRNEWMMIFNTKKEAKEVIYYLSDAQPSKHLLVQSQQ